MKRHVRLIFKKTSNCVGPLNGEKGYKLTKRTTKTEKKGKILKNLLKKCIIS